MLQLVEKTEMSVEPLIGDPSLRLDKQLCFGLYAATHAMTKVYRPMLVELGLTYSQYLVLLALWENDRQTVSALGEVLLLDSGTLSPVLKRLEAAGLVSKTRQRKDERLVEIALTAKGRDMHASAINVREQMVCHIGMSDAEIAGLRRNLDLLLLALQPRSAPMAG